ncbi:MAG: four helix bundle protein, partial [Eubacterium sp.]|uniref:four helix bundle protein n=1 Tax=Eubacterium sp. TaxID=142586 RepID=UPI0039A29C26
ENGKWKIFNFLFSAIIAILIYTNIMDNVIENKSFQFAIRIVRLYKFLCEEKKEYILSKQLLRAGTSIGANVTESQQAQSKPDFVSKISIALKEASETKYWIKLLGATEYLSENQTNSILDDCVEIEKILVTILKSAKNQ